MDGDERRGRLSSFVVGGLLFVTSSYLNGSSTLSFPDVSGVKGFIAAPSSGTSVGWAAQVMQASQPAWQSLAANKTMVAVSNAGEYTVP